MSDCFRPGIICEPQGNFTIYCPCGVLHVHLAVPRYVTVEAAAAMATKMLAPCPSCGEKPRPVPTSTETSR